MKKCICKFCWKEFDKPKWYKYWNLCSAWCRDKKYYSKEKKAEYSKKYRKYKTYNCVICWKEIKVIDDYRVKWISEQKICKNEKCKIQHRRNIDNIYNDKKRDEVHFLKDNSEGTTEDTFFSDNKHLYQDKLIDYPNSPTWKAYIWLAKRPLMENDNWIWFKGVLLQSENRNLVECSITWKWFKIIPTKHLEKNWYTREKYKEEFWLNNTQSLVSDTYSRFYAANMTNVASKNMNVSKEKRQEWLSKWRKTMSDNREKKYNTDQMKNDKWTCDLQLKHRFISYILWHYKYPPQNKFPYKSLKDRFWSINNALKSYWLPTRKQFGYTVLYEFEDWYTFKIISWKWYSELFEIMKMKCLVLNDNITIS